VCVYSEATAGLPPDRDRERHRDRARERESETAREQGSERVRMSKRDLEQLVPNMHTLGIFSWGTSLI
jgi:hypothetical protein